jgi:tetratricopeptide (TPR) repeat protein
MILRAALAAMLLLSALAPIPARAQIKLTPPSGQASHGVRLDPGPPDSGAATATGSAAAPGPDQPSGPDLLSRYEKPTGGKPRWLSKLLGLLGAGGAPAKQGAKAYAEGDYDKALQKFSEAQLDNPESQALAFDMGNAQYRKKKYDDAIAAYKKALRGEDAGLAASSYYNLGNAHFRKGEFAIQNGKQEGIEDYREAMANYKKSLEIRPDNKDAKRNIEVVQARIKELLEKQKQDQKQQGNPQKPPEPSEEAKKVLARALQLVQERRYAEAKTLLEDLIQKDKTAITYQSFVQRIDDVLKILRGETPTPPQTQDPRASQPGVGVI